jgi:hypothetical protein
MRQVLRPFGRRWHRSEVILSGFLPFEAEPSMHSRVIMNFVVRSGGCSISWNFGVDTGASLGQNADVKVGRAT